MRQVRGVLFLDYVRMLRRSGSPNVGGHLQPADLELLSSQVDLGAWYPMETFERFGLAILAGVVGREVDSIRLWGRSQIPQILSFFPDLRAAGDPRDTIIRFSNLLGSLFDFPAVTLDQASDDRASVRISYGMGAIAEEAASWQTLGFFEALIEESGGGNVRSQFIRKSWITPGQTTLVELNWTRRASSPDADHEGPPRILLVDDESLVRGALARLLEPSADVSVAGSVVEAMRLLETTPFDVVVADYDLGPGPRGLELLTRVARRWPGYGRILHSGSPPPEAQSALDQGIIHAIVEKPASVGELLRIIQELPKG
jgi:CheY-like chemotaxis protein